VRTVAQLKTKSRNLSKETGTPVHIIQRNFLFERFLERVSLSDCRDSFIIKGGVLITSMIGIDVRATVDLDATLRGGDIEENEVRQIINSIINIDMKDSAAFTLFDIERTRVESDYPGWRITIKASFDSIRDTLKLDITVGDVITPRAVEYSYKLMFEDRCINLMAYNLETVLAEKFVACISFGVSNSRMKDYYDIYILTKLRRNEIDLSVFADALAKTTAQRQVSLIESIIIIDEISADPEMSKLWDRYQVDNPYAAGISFSDTVSTLRILSGALK